MNQQLVKIQQSIDALNQRERVLILFTAVVVVAALLYLLLIEPLMIKQQANSLQLKELKATVMRQESEKMILEAELQVGVNRKKQAQRDSLSEELSLLNEKIQQSVVGMIPPRMMPEVLERLLIDSKGLELLGLENQPVSTVVQQSSEAAPAEGDSVPEESVEQSLYKHGFTLRLRGDYLSVLAYFEKLAELPWRFHWDSLNYQVEQYPKATVELEVHTVSMSEGWIGV